MATSFNHDSFHGNARQTRTDEPWEVAPAFGFRGGDIRTVSGQVFLFQRLNPATDVDARAVAEVPAMVDMLRRCADWFAGGGDEPQADDIRAILARIDGEA